MLGMTNKTDKLDAQDLNKVQRAGPGDAHPLRHHIPQGLEHQGRVWMLGAFGNPG